MKNKFGVTLSASVSGTKTIFHLRSVDVALYLLKRAYKELELTDDPSNFSPSTSDKRWFLWVGNRNNPSSPQRKVGDIYITREEGYTRDMVLTIDSSSDQKLSQKNFTIANKITKYLTKSV